MDHMRISGIYFKYLPFACTTGWVTVAADRPESARNGCVIERFLASLCYFEYVLSVV